MKTFGEFLEAGGTFAGTTPMDGATAAHPQQKAAPQQQKQQSNQDFVTRWEEPQYFNRLKVAYSSGDPKYPEMFNQAVATGKYYQDHFSREDMYNWWSRYAKTVAEAQPTKAQTDRTLQRVNAYLQNKDYANLYNFNMDADDDDSPWDGETKMQKVGGGVRDADSILQFSSKAQHSDL